MSFVRARSSDVMFCIADDMRSVVLRQQVGPQPLLECLETALGVSGLERVAVELAHPARQVVGQQIEAQPAILCRRRGVGRPALVPAGACRLLTGVDGVALLVDDVGELPGDLLVHAAEIVALQPLAPLGAQPVEQLAQTLYALAPGVQPFAHQPAQRGVHVAVVEQLVGQLAEERVGVELEAALGPVPARVPEPGDHAATVPPRPVDPPPPITLSAMRVPRTFVFVDLSGFTNYTAAFGDDAAGRILGAFRSIVRQVASERGVRIAKWLGDGVMLVAVDQQDAVAFTLELEARSTAVCAPLTLRVGVATGYALLFEGDDYIGSAVNMAARLCDAADSYEVLIPTMHLERLPAGVTATPHPDVELRGFPGAIEVVQLTGTPAPSPQNDTGELWTREPF